MFITTSKNRIKLMGMACLWLRKTSEHYGIFVDRTRIVVVQKS